MMKKKILAFLLTLAMLMSLVACANNAATNNGTNGDNSTNNSGNNANTNEPSGDNDTTTPPVSTGDGEYRQFDDFPHPIVKPEGNIKIGVMVNNLTSESLYRWDWQFQVEAAHRGWEYVSFQYQTDDNYEATFQSALNQGVDAIIVLSIASSARWADLYDMAREQGVGVYSLDQGYGGYICGASSPGMTMMSELLYRVGSDYNWDLDCAIIRNDPQQDSRDRTYPLLGFFDNQTYPNMNLVVTEDISAISASVGGSMMAGLEIGRTWMEQYGDEIQCVFSYGDNSAMGMAEAIMASGDLTGEKTFTVGIDGGRQCWSYIRNGEPVKYSYAQAFEYQAHMIAEIIEQIQVQGLCPGDEGCDVSKPQSMLYFKGGVVTQDNVPEIGTTIHQVFDYYDPNITDPEIAWWLWEDGPGIYLVEAYEE